MAIQLCSARGDPEPYYGDVTSFSNASFCHCRVPIRHTNVHAGRSDAVLRGVVTRMQQLCSARGEPEPYCGDVVSAAVRLGAKRLVLAGPGAHRLAMRSVTFFASFLIGPENIC